MTGEHADPADTDIEGDPLATINQRVAARAIDWIAVLIVSVAFGGLTAVEAEDGSVTTPAWVVIATLVFIFVYEAAPVRLRGQTLGKFLIGIELVMLRGGHTPGLGPASLRAAPVVVLMALLANLALLVLVFVYFTAAFARDRRGLLDRFAGTVVIAARPTG